MIFNNVMFVLIDSFLFLVCLYSSYFPLNVFVLSECAMFFSIRVHFFYCFIWGSLSADIACMTNLPCHFQTSSLSVRQQHNTVSNVCTMRFWSSTHCESYQARLQLSNMGNIHYDVIFLVTCILLWIMHCKQPFHNFRPFPFCVKFAFYFYSYWGNLKQCGLLDVV